MKKYSEITVKKMKIEKVFCNCCGKELSRDTDYLSVEKQWGYHSNKDGVCQSFDLCEECVDRLTSEFAIPPQTEDKF